MLNDLVSTFTSGNASSEVYYNGTVSLNEYISSPEIVKCFYRVAENLGDSQLPNLRKASHQLFQTFIRRMQVFDPVLTAMISRGIVHPNWIVRQKNVNSLQCLILSEGRFFPWNGHLVKPLVELLLNKLSDQHPTVAKATEQVSQIVKQTLLTIIQQTEFKLCYSSFHSIVQLQIEDFVESMKAANLLDKNYVLVEKKQTSPAKSIHKPPLEPIKERKHITDSITNDTQCKQIAQMQIKNQSQNMIETLKSSQNSSIQKEVQSQFDISTASSSRSEMTQNTLANRLKNKQEMMASQKEEESTYVPSILTKVQRKSDQKPDPEPEQERQRAVTNTKPFRMVKNVQQIEEMQPVVAKVTYSKPFQKKTLADKTSQPIYLDEIDELLNPDQIAKNILTDLKYEEWSRQFDALNNLRRLIKHNSDLLKKSGNLLAIIGEVIKLSESLRSGVCKNALLCLSELSERYKKELDFMLDSAYKILIKKSIDSNQFISEEVKKCMVTLFLQCSESKCIALASNVYQSKSNPVKQNLCHSFNGLLAKGLDSQQNFEKLVYFLCVFVCDQAQEVRSLAKEGLLSLDMDSQDLENLIVKVAPKPDFKRIMTILKSDATGSNFRSSAGQTKFKSTDARTPVTRNRTPNLKL